MDWRTLLILLHILGTIFGVAGVTFALAFSRKALADGKVDASEGASLSITYTFLRLGLILVVLSGFGILLYTRLESNPANLYSVRLWLKLTITAVLLLNTILLMAKRLPAWLAHGISFVGWYAAFIIGAWRGYHWSYLTGIVVLALFSVIVGLILRKTEIHKHLRA